RAEVARAHVMEPARARAGDDGERVLVVLEAEAEARRPDLVPRRERAHDPRERARARLALARLAVGEEEEALHVRARLLLEALPGGLERERDVRPAPALEADDRLEENTRVGDRPRGDD